MDQQVSPAVVIIVLILIVAILVGLYFLVVERKPQSGEDEPVMDMVPVDDGEVPPDAGTTDEPADDAQAEADAEADADADQGDTDAEQTENGTNGEDGEDGNTDDGVGDTPGE